MYKISILLVIFGKFGWRYWVGSHLNINQNIQDWMICWFRYSMDIMIKLIHVTAVIDQRHVYNHLSSIFFINKANKLHLLTKPMICANISYYMCILPVVPTHVIAFIFVFHLFHFTFFFHAKTGTNIGKTLCRSILTVITRYFTEIAFLNNSEIVRHFTLFLLLNDSDCNHDSWDISRNLFSPTTMTRSIITRHFTELVLPYNFDYNHEIFHGTTFTVITIYFTEMSILF
jgi:hypothetical protein